MLLFVIQDRFVKKADLYLNLYPCVIKYYLSLHWLVVVVLLGSGGSKYVYRRGS